MEQTNKQTHVKLQFCAKISDKLGFVCDPYEKVK